MRRRYDRDRPRVKVFSAGGGRETGSGRLARYPYFSLVISVGFATKYTRITAPLTQNTMSKALTKSQIAAAIAEKAEISKKQATAILEIIAALAYKNAKNSFTLPGLGKLVLVHRKARQGRNPATGETIQIKAKKVVKFRVAKAAKDAILGAK